MSLLLLLQLFLVKTFLASAERELRFQWFLFWFSTNFWKSYELLLLIDITILYYHSRLASAKHELRFRRVGIIGNLKRKMRKIKENQRKPRKPRNLHLAIYFRNWSVQKQMAHLEFLFFCSFFASGIRARYFKKGVENIANHLEFLASLESRI